MTSTLVLFQYVYLSSATHCPGNMYCFLNCHWSISFDYYCQYWAHTSFAPVGIIVIYDNVLVCVFHSKTSILRLNRIWFRPWGLRAHQDLGRFFSCWSYSTAERNHSAPFPSQLRGRGPKWTLLPVPWLSCGYPRGSRNSQIGNYEQLQEVNET